MQRDLFTMNAGGILIVSEQPLLRDVLKLTVEKAGLMTVATASDEISAARLASELAPSVIVLDRPDTRATDLDSFFQGEDYSIKVVVIGCNDDKIAVYSRSTGRTATLQNLIKAIKKKK
ncbi:hypothetical protein ACFLW4_05590 [Chloroflexota bacterium]